MKSWALPYCADSASLFDVIADERWAVLLESGHPRTQAHVDILAARPYLTLVTRGTDTEVTDRGGTRVVRDDPLDLLRRHMRKRPGCAPVALSGGAIGYLGYDLALSGHPPTPRTSLLPDMAMGLYDWVVIVDHERRETRLVMDEFDPGSADKADELVRLFSEAGELAKPRERCRVTAPWRSSFTHSSYQQAFRRIQEYIGAGDCYQINLAQRFSAEVTGDPWSAYLAMREANPAPYGAYLNYPFGQILSYSPESFLRLRGNAVETSPIKGTRPRATDAARDAELARELVRSAKDRAENLMIVDLLRNDLGKVCVPGSVRVPKIFELTSFESVHHLVSHVTGRLAAGHDAIDLLRASFPGGSITGTPKVRAMEIIAELEPAPRSVYCGAIGWLGSHGDMDLSIAIRTAAITQGQVHYWAGGGIVADSDADEEYQECLDKAAAFFRFVERHRA